MYRDTVTVFNCKRGIDGDIWYPTILHDVNLNMDKGSVIKQYGAESQDNAILFVRYTKDGDTIKVGSNIWLPPKEWQGLSDQAGKFTFDDNGDFFWLGEWSGSVAYEGAYGSQTFYEYMLANYDFVFAVTSVNYLSVIPHFEVTGK